MIDVVVRVTVEEVSLLVNFGFTSLLGSKPKCLVDEEAEYLFMDDGGDGAVGAFDDGEAGGGADVDVERLLHHVDVVRMRCTVLYNYQL